MDIGEILILTLVVVIVLLGTVSAIGMGVGGATTAPVRDRLGPWLESLPGKVSASRRAGRGPRLGVAPPAPRTTPAADAGAASATDSPDGAVSPVTPATAPTPPLAAVAVSPSPLDAAEWDRRWAGLRAEVGEGLRAASAAAEERAARADARLGETTGRVERALADLGRETERRATALAAAVAEVGRETRARGAAVETGMAEVGRETAARSGALEAGLAAAEARQSAALDRLRADLPGLLGAAEARATADRRAARALDALAELYARLARLEAAVAAVTNPILLPGEPYAPPVELLPEALAWESWKDVGERAFAFADHFNAHRLSLPEPLGSEVATFIADLRGVLTRSIYPNLRPHPAAAELHTLRAALDRLAQDLPTIRGRLERAFRAPAGG